MTSLFLMNGIGACQTLELPTSFFFLCLQSLYMEKYFRLEENVLKDFLKKQEVWEKEKSKAAEPEETTVSKF